MSSTVNAFPPLHAFTSARSWFMAIIVLLHVGFFVALSSGMMPNIVKAVTHSTVLVTPTPDTDEPVPEPTKIDVDIPVSRFTAVPLEQPVLTYDEPPIQVAPPETQLPPGDGPVVPEAPRTVVTQPEGAVLTEPYYPAPEIRLGHEGTVLLSVYVLPNGRVGEVRLERSSGFARLDESATREARKWRFKPGMQDGTPVAMWKQIPITFQLKNQ